MEPLHSHLFQQSSSSSQQIRVKSFHPETTNGKPSNLNSNLPSNQLYAQQPSQEPNNFTQTYNSQPNERSSKVNLMRTCDRQYMFNPQIYESYRTEHLIQEIEGDHFKILYFSKGRVQYHFQNCIQLELPGIVTLTHFINGDYKISSNQMVYFWHQHQQVLQKYSNNT